MARVFVEPIGVTVEIDDGDSLLAAITSAAVAVPTDCAGRGTCGKCLVRLGAGSLSEPTEVERRKLPSGRLAQGWRLACQARPLTPRVSIEVRETSGRRQILTASKLKHGAAHPAVVKETVQLVPPSLGDACADLGRLRHALPGVEVPLTVLRDLPVTLRDSDWRVLVTRYGGRLVDVEGADVEPRAVGAAVDIGTSKIIVYLFDLLAGRQLDQEAVENPQMRFGEDIVTRITQAMHEGRQSDLADLAREGINSNLKRLYRRQGIAARHVYDVTVVGNTAMHHLALGVSPEGLGAAPFAPAVDEPVLLRGADLGLDVNPEAGVYFLPPIAGFVGSDALAVVAATRLEAKREPAMAIDIGTNTEIALVHDGEIAVTSCASGPAFEGYQLECGMKATEGAIERVSLAADGYPSVVRTIGGAPPVGICGSGVVDLLAGLVRAGVVDSSGRMQEHPLVHPGRDGLRYVLTPGAGGDIVFTQHDVRNLQLAKAAIGAGWSLLLDKVGLAAEELRHVFVAGAFGNYLDVEHAVTIGLLPPLPRSRIKFVGNAAGVGAQMALIDTHERERIAALRRRIGFLELATNKEFHTVFTSKLSFS